MSSVCMIDCTGIRIPGQRGLAQASFPFFPLPPLCSFSFIFYFIFIFSLSLSTEAMEIGDASTRLSAQGFGPAPGAPM